MKSLFIACTMLFSAACGAAVANAPANLLVYAQSKSEGSMWAGSKSAFTKTFDVSIANLTDQDIDLATLCLRAYASDTQSFGVDTVDDLLTKGWLKKGSTVSGVVVFSSGKRDVYQAAMVKVFHDCP